LFRSTYKSLTRQVTRQKPSASRQVRREQFAYRPVLSSFGV